jgi:hypothetical protein
MTPAFDSPACDPPADQACHGRRVPRSESKALIPTRRTFLEPTAPTTPKNFTNPVSIIRALLALLALGLTADAGNPKDFTVRSPTHGTTFTLSKAHGKAVALHFLPKTECPFCLKHTHDYATQAASMPGHTLPNLGQMHCVNPPVEFRAELARNWGFAVRLSRPHGEPELIRLCQENPTVFKPAAMIGNLANLEASKSIPWPEGTFLRTADGSRVEGRQIFGPEMPDAAWQILVDEAQSRIDGQLGGLPASSLATVENWTEHGLTVPIEIARLATQDPKVLAAKGERSWQEYVTQRKAYYEGRMREAIKRRYPNAHYTSYTYGGFTGPPDGGWAWDFHYLKVATDSPSPERCYNYFNSGFVGANDMLTLRLQARHIEIQEGFPLYLGWLSAGYERRIADYQGDSAQGMYAQLPRWMGYLKMSYLAGMLGGVTTGEFGCDVRYEPFDPALPPKWLDQMLALAHTHALFTWIETDLRNSRLLPGPNTHAWNQDRPAYEFPTGHRDTRILIRRVTGVPRWLIGAWAADGVERYVTITVPDLGEYRILARPAGTVQWVDQLADKRSATWLDENQMQPSLAVRQ